MVSSFSPLKRGEKEGCFWIFDITSNVELQDHFLNAES